MTDLGFLSPEHVAKSRECTRLVVRDLQNLLKAISQFPLVTA
jgi:hypothetical protein